jgi:hypothetical protein
MKDSQKFLKNSVVNASGQTHMTVDVARLYAGFQAQFHGFSPGEIGIQNFSHRVKWLQVKSLAKRLAIAA